MSIVELKGLGVAYAVAGQSRPAVRDLDLVIESGQTVAIVGESGSGKSTTANAVIGLLPPHATVTGQILVDGVDVTHAPDRVRRKLRGPVVSLVPQDPTVGLNPTIRIGAQVADVVRRRGGVDKRALDAEVVEALTVAGLDDPVQRARQYPHELSGGQRQRVLIAIALAANPRLVIADEPTSALDVTVQRTILDHLEKLVAERGISLLIITHDLGVAADRADRVLVMQDGRLVEHGAPATILRQPAHVYTRALLDAAPALAPDGSLLTRHVHVEPAEPILVVDGLSKRFPLPHAPGSARFVQALDDVSLVVGRGQTLGVVGESGSGKTTLLRAALGLEHADAGTVAFDGTLVTGRSWRELRVLRRRFQLVQQNPYAALDPRLSVAQSIGEPLIAAHLGTRTTRRARAAELLDLVALPSTALDARPAELSGGQRQRVAIARALAVSPDLVFLDEPVSALDVSVQDQILTLLADLQRDLGLSYVLVSHDLAVVAQVAHTVAVLARGRLVEAGTTHDVFTSPQHTLTRELLDAVPGRSLRVSS